MSRKLTSAPGGGPSDAGMANHPDDSSEDDEDGDKKGKGKKGKGKKRSKSAESDGKKKKAGCVIF